MHFVTHLHIFNCIHQQSDSLLNVGKHGKDINRHHILIHKCHEQNIWSYLSGLFGIGGELDIGCATILCTLVGRRLLVLLRMLEKRPLPLVGLQQNIYKDQKG